MQCSAWRLQYNYKGAAKLEIVAIKSSLTIFLLQYIAVSPVKKQKQKLVVTQLMQGNR